MGRDGRLAEVWEAIDAVVPRAELKAAVATITGMVPPPAPMPTRDWRAELARRIVTVSGFVKILTEVIEFGSNTDGARGPGGDAGSARPAGPPQETHDCGHRADAGDRVVEAAGVRQAAGRPGSVADAYVFCVLTEFHRHLRRRDIYAEASSRWRDPRAQLLAGRGE